VLLHAAVRGQTRRQDGHLDRIDEDMILSKSLKPMPSIAGFEHPMRSVVCRLRRHRLRLPYVEPPGIVHLLLHSSHGAPETERLVDCFLHERTTGRLFHHRRGNVAGRDDAVLRRRRSMHHKRLVEARHIQPLLFAVLYMNHGRLRQCGQQLVRGLGRKGDGMR
jgi:hypothetical protein